MEKTVAKILIAGDLSPSGRSESFLRQVNAEHIWGTLPQLAAEHDFCVANLEAPLTSRTKLHTKVGPCLRAHPDVANGIRSAGFQALSLANNHILDMGVEGLRDTLQACVSAGLSTVGAGNNLAEAQRPLLVNIDGTHIAILAFAEHEFSLATGNTAGACPLDEIENYHQIIAAKQNSDFVVLLIHGGNEYYALPSPRLVRLSHYFIDIGAGAVVWHHSHVATGFEIYQEAPIFYGIGNLLFDWPVQRESSWYFGYLVSLSVEGNQARDFEIIPYIQCKEDVGVSLLRGPARDAFLSEIGQRNTVIGDMAVLEQNWRDFCRQKRPQYLAALFAGNPLMKLLWRKGWLTPEKLGARQFIVLNLIRCQAHRDVLIEALLHDDVG